MVTVAASGGRASMSWPTALPTPTLEGDAAVYAEVLPGVDLRVRATGDGFSHVLVVKTRAAASNPAVRELNLSWSNDGLALSSDGDGTLTLRRGGRAVLKSLPAMMWDSAIGDSGAVDVPTGQMLTQGTAGGPEADASTPEAPGDLAKVAEVEVTLEGQQTVLRPDPAMLDGVDTVFPLYIDPFWNSPLQRWMYANDKGNNRSDGYARVGANPDGSGLYRSFFEFQLGDAVKYKTIHSATFSSVLDHSGSCVGTTVSLWRATGISTSYGNGSRIPWSPTLTDHLDERFGHANETYPSNCSGGQQPDMYMEFGGNLKNKVQEWVNSAWGSVVLTLSTRRADGTGESNTYYWKKYFPTQTKLSIEYNTTPYTPTAAQLSTHAEYTSSGLACVTGSSRPLNRSLTPYLKATLTDPDGVNGPSNGYLAGTFTVQKLSGSTWSTLSGWPKTVWNVAHGAKAEIQISSGLAEANIVRWQVQTQDAGGLTSGWSPWCEFAVDAAAPSAKPKVATADGVYQEKTVNPNAQGSIGKSGRFTFSANGVPDVKKYVYRFDNGSEVTVDAVNSSGVPTLGGSATITVTPSHAAENVLTVRSVDQGGNSSGNYDYGFIVDVLSSPVAHWAMDEASGTTLNSAIAGGPNATAFNGTARVGGRLLGDKVGVGVDRAIRLDGVDDYAAPASSPIDTSRSFAVGAWVRLDAKGGDRVIASKDGGGTYASFYLQFEIDCDCWRMQVPSTTDSNAAWTRADSTIKAQLGVWTHVAGSYDPASKRVKVYVNGVAEASVSGSVAAFNYSSGQFRVGKANAFWNGDLDDVRVWDRLLDASQDLKPLQAPVKVGQWDFEDCFGPTLLDESSFEHHGAFSHDPDDMANPVYWGDGYDYTCGAMFEGTAGAITTTGPVVRTDQSFTVAAYLRIDAMPTGVMTAVSQDGTWRSGFYLGVRQLSGVPSWSFTMHEEDSDPNQGGSTAGVTASAGIDELQVGQWVHLIGVYDAHAQKTRLYVDGVKVSVQNRTSRWSADGAWAMGRARWTSTGGSPQSSDWWAGGLDRVWTFAGAMSDSQISALYQALL